MFPFLVALLTAATISAPAFAESHATGDATAGAALFFNCQACHVVRDAEGIVLAGQNGKFGPNLFAVLGRTAGTLERFKFGASIVAAGAAGLVWDEEQIANYLQDPKNYLRTYLDDPNARSKMTTRVLEVEDALNLAAFLATFSPTVEGTTATN